MAITRTFIQTRPDTSTAFTNEVTSITEFVELESLLQACIAAGNVTLTVNVSSDGLTQTKARSSENLETFNSVENLLRSYGLSKALFDYGGSTHVSTTTELTGIDQPFTVTTVYTTDTLSNTSTIGSSITTNAGYGLSNVIVESNNITMVHTYNNSADYSTHDIVGRVEGRMLSNINVMSKTATIALI